VDVAAIAVVVALPVGVAAAGIAAWRLLRSRALTRGGAMNLHLARDGKCLCSSPLVVH
jgi:hypothetical protein